MIPQIVQLVKLSSILKEVFSFLVSFFLFGPSRSRVKKKFLTKMKKNTFPFLQLIYLFHELELESKHKEHVLSHFSNYSVNDPNTKGKNEI